MDRFANFASTPTSPARRMVRVVPSDTADLPEGPARLWIQACNGMAFVPVGNADDEIVWFGSSQINNQPHPLPVIVRRVMATGTAPNAVIYAVME